MIAIGCGLIALTVVVIAAFIGIANMVLKRTGNWFVRSRLRVLREILGLTTITLWMLAALFFAACAWAITFLVLGVFTGFEQSLYFSLVSFTTLGFGDVVIEDQWRMLSPFVAANGLVLFSLVTAYLITALRKILGHQ